LTNDTDVDNLNGDLSVSAVRTGTEAGSGNAGTVGSGLAGTYGTLTLNSDGTYSYAVDNSNAAVQALNAGDTLTDTFTYTVKDPGNLTDTAQLTVTIHGANDDAVIAGTSAGSVTEASGVNNGTPGTPSATGLLTDSDVDNPPNSFQPVAAGTASDQGFGSYQMTAGGTWTYTVDDTNASVQALNAGGTLTDTFTVHTVDGTAQQVTVTIHGA